MTRPRLVLLTTDTPHHRYFAWQVSQQFPFAAIVVESGAVRPPFETVHPFEDERDDYERRVLLGGNPCELTDVASVLQVENIAGDDALGQVQDLKPDIVMVFGTRRIREPLPSLARVACLNLHGGNPEEYRGLDSHLWSIYHRDFANLVTTLHHVDAGLDTGSIVAQRSLTLGRAMPLSELRALTTRACVQMTVDALATVNACGTLPAVPQRRIGRYYSFMPSVLKTDCITKFSRHVSSL